MKREAGAKAYWLGKSAFCAGPNRTPDRNDLVDGYRTEAGTKGNDISIRKIHNNQMSDVEAHESGLFGARREK